MPPEKSVPRRWGFLRGPGWIDTARPGRGRFLLKSRDLYRQAFEAFPSDYYTGINAASKSLLAGEKETAAQIAERVQKIVGEKAVADDYWKTATTAEVQLLQGRIDAAAALYATAVLAAPLDHGSHQSTLAQARLLLAALGATQQQSALVEAAFPAAPRDRTPEAVNPGSEVCDGPLRFARLRANWTSRAAFRAATMSSASTIGSG